jgi:adenylosuccinate synthase
MKAYTTRVGSGPFPTELHGQEGKDLRAAGHEYGATTGRPRRCGWLDLVAAKYAVTVSGIQSIALTKIDVLTGMETIKVCTGYEYEGKVYTKFPPEIKILENCTPIYEELEGWTEDLTVVRKYEDLPDAAKKYLDFVKDFLGVKYAIVSLGTDRIETIKMEEIF